MKEILQWIRKHKRLTMMLLVLVVFLPIIVIHILFKIKSNCYWIQAEWDAGYMLGYCGDVLSFIGTIVLGYIAVMQTERANHMNQELLNIEKSRVKPYFDISSSQLYKIFLAEDMDEKLNELDRNSVMIMDLLCALNPRTGLVTDSALIELEVLNSGYSDIRRVMVRRAYFYLSVSEPIEYNNEKIAIIYGNTAIKSNESRLFYIHIKREIVDTEELYKNWYKDNIDKIMPRMEFELELETVTGNFYIEKIECGSSWDISMKNTNNTATRAIGVTKIQITEEES